MYATIQHTVSNNLGKVFAMTVVLGLAVALFGSIGQIQKNHTTLVHKHVQAIESAVNGDVANAQTNVSATIDNAPENTFRF